MLQSVDYSGYRAGLDHNMFGDLRWRHRAVFIKGKKAAKLGNADPILLLKLFSVKLLRLDQPAYQIDDLLDLILKEIIIYHLERPFVTLRRNVLPFERDRGSRYKEM